MNSNPSALIEMIVINCTNLAQAATLKRKVRKIHESLLNLGYPNHQKGDNHGYPNIVVFCLSVDMLTAIYQLYNSDLPENSLVIGDKAHNNCTIEDVTDEASIVLLPIRKKNSLRPLLSFVSYFQATIRKVVETTGSLIERLLLESIHAVTAKGFELEVTLFLIASFNFLW